MEADMHKNGSMPKYLPRAYRPRYFSGYTKTFFAYATLVFAVSFIVAQVVVS